MKRYLMVNLLFITMFFCSLLPNTAGAVPKVAADAAVLMDASTGQVLYDKNGSKRRAPASLTKITTGIIAFEYGHLGEIVSVSPKAGAVSMGSTIGLQEGDKITLSNLLKAALITSANDSTVAIAEHIGSSHDEFINLMNKKAVALGALNTHFANTNGYSNPNHYTTARDLALITRYALKNEMFNRLVGTKETTVSWYDPVKYKEVKNTNRVLTNGDYPGIDGVKTGTAVTAGKCYIASASRDGRRLIAVVLHSSRRYEDAVKLLEYGFKEMNLQKLCQRGQVLAQIPVSEGPRSAVLAAAKNDVTVYMDKENPLEVRKRIIRERLTAPVHKGDVIGKVIYETDEGELARTDLVAVEGVRSLFWPERMLRKAAE